MTQEMRGAADEGLPTQHDIFGTLADGRAIAVVTLTNANGLIARVLTLGATLQALHVPDRDGGIADVVLGYDELAGYETRPNYFGATVGRYANRIANARFTIDGETFVLEANDGGHHLHGGASGFHARLWTIESATASSVRLILHSADGEGGYPGALDVAATYTLDDGDALTITYEATTDRATIVNLTNHSFFNLAGAGDVRDHRLTLQAQAFTPVDATLIPTGERRAVSGTPFDFRVGKAICEDIDADDQQLRMGSGYDHNFILDGNEGALRLAARLEHRASGRVLDLFTDAPGIQLYSGNFLDGSITGKGGRVYGVHAGVCLEPQTFPDAPNRSDFPSARLDPGDIYRRRIVYRCSTRARDVAPTDRPIR